MKYELPTTLMKLNFVEIHSGITRNYKKTQFNALDLGGKTYRRQMAK